MDRAMRDLPCKTLQVYEIWTFVGAKQKNVKPDKEAQGRFTRLTNAFAESYAAAVSLDFAYYNYCRPISHSAARPRQWAQAWRIYVWKVDELIALLEVAESVPVKRGAYRKSRERKAELRGEVSN
jgi:hypothetical protein